ncbi:MAG: DUF6878 family protein [Ilumatobacteraceae bacterium]
MDKNTLFRTLSAKGITKVVIHFSGGNDEGGADSALATMTDGSEQSLPDQYSVHQDWQTKQWVTYDEKTRAQRPATAEEQAAAVLSQALEQPIYDRWGSFAGEFSVDGTLTWDVLAQSVKLDGQESVEHYESFEDEL